MQRASTRFQLALGLAAVGLSGAAAPAAARLTLSAALQAVAPATPPAPAQAESDAGPSEDRPATFMDEVDVTAYVENSGILNLGASDAEEVNELRFYDFEDGVSFNMAEAAVKKASSEAHPLGFGLVVTAGRDAQKNHALGLLRDERDVFPFEDTSEFDWQELYASYRLPVGGGLGVKAGKFVTLLGYEVIESPLNLNLSRSLLFVYSAPLTHVGALASYAVTPRLSITAGPVAGWDVLDDNNEAVSWIGQVAITPAENLTTNVQWIVGPEQTDADAVRSVVDLVVNYTAVQRLTLGLNADVGWEEDEPALAAVRPAGDSDASWWGVAGYAAYDWTERLRTAARLELFEDSDGVRTLAVGPGQGVSLWELTATAQVNIWGGLFGRLEYRHEGADEPVFDLDADGAPSSDSQDTVALAFHYLFF